MSTLSSKSVWIPRFTVVAIFATTCVLPFGYRFGELGPIILGVIPVVLGGIGFFWSMSLQRVGLAVANALCGVFAVPILVVLVTIVNGP